jgi:hypothetical protein
MSKTMTLTPKGLFTYYNSLADISPGALLKANNIVIQQEGIAQPRRGIKYWSNTFGVEADRAKQLFEYKSRILTHYSNKIAFDTTGSGAFSNFNGTYNAPLSNTRIKSLESKGNFYFTSDSGVKKISAKTISDITASSITNAGVVAALGGEGKARIPEIGFLESQYKCIYKVTWAFLDNNNLLIEGAASDDIIVYNNSAYNNTYVDLSIIVPTQINNTNYIYRIYRSNSVPVADTPEREFNLVFEGNPTNTEISTRRLNYTDKLLNEFRSGGLPLYTNAVSGGGSLSANEIPPYAVDLALYSNHLFYANTKLAHFKEYSIQSIANLFNQTLTISDGYTSNEYFFDGAIEENTVKAEAPAFTVSNAYFLLTAANNEREYYVRLKKDATVFNQNAETDQRFEILVDITAAATASDVATAILNAVNAVGDFSAVYVTDSTGLVVSGSPTAYVKISNVNNGTAVTYDDLGAVLSPYGLTDSTLIPTNYIFSHQATGVGENASLKQVLWSGKEGLMGVEETAKSLVKVININSSEIVTAYYISGVNDTPGKIILKRKDFQALPFYMSTDSLLATIDIFPNIPLDTDPINMKQYGSEDSAAVNALYISKPDQPESVPLSNVVLVGSSDAPILRIVALRESLFIFKTDGVYRLNGNDVSNFSVNLFDGTAILKVPDSVAVLTNEIYYFGNQGIAKLSEVGNTVISTPIQNKFLPLISTAPSLAPASFGIAYETDRSYMIWTLLTKADTVAQVAYRFNVETNTWVEWKIPKTCAVLNVAEDKLYFGSSSVNLIEVERKNFDRFDNCDREINVEIPAASFNGSVVRPSGASNFEAGDVMIQYQYLTINRVTQILRMLDLDYNMGTPDWESTLQVYPGDNLSSRVTAIVAQLNSRDPSGFTDSWGNTAYVFSGTNDFATILTEWNKLIDRLNESPTAYYSNYPKYTYVVPVEAQVLSRDISNNDVYLNKSLAYLEGAVTLYKSITSETEFVPQHGGDPLSFKQFSTAQATFENRSFHSARLGFNSDLSTDFEYIDFAPNSYSIYGNDFYGSGSVWGGFGDKAPLRTFVPRKKQRAKFVGVRVYHSGALESYSLYGVTLTYRAYEVDDRAYR